MEKRVGFRVERAIFIPVILGTSRKGRASENVARLALKIFRGGKEMRTKEKMICPDCGGTHTRRAGSET
ncbi:MAG TPA: hypothetical protein VEQ40_12070 [Pyrinomonadaceae bacterium]|nr:hypothetical protein [Pyrinomonadaceae bacterium]